MIKHLMTHYIDKEGYLLEVSVNLYDDGIQITSMNPDKKLNGYWPHGVIKLITPWSRKKPAQIECPEQSSGQLLIEDKSFFNALVEKLPNAKVPTARTPLTWRTIGIGLFVAVLLGSIVMAMVFTLHPERFKQFSPSQSAGQPLDG